MLLLVIFEKVGRSEGLKVGRSKGRKVGRSEGKFSFAICRTFRLSDFQTFRLSDSQTIRLSDFFPGSKCKYHPQDGAVEGGNEHPELFRKQEVDRLCWYPEEGDALFQHNPPHTVPIN